MNHTAIYKYPLGDMSSLRPVHRVELPQGAQILSAQVQRGQAVLWAQVDPKVVSAMRPLRMLRAIRVVVTGEPCELPPDAKFIATLQFAEGDFVVHLFDLGERA